VLSVAFNFDASLIALTSNKSTIHVFVVQGNQPYDVNVKVCARYSQPCRRGWVQSWVTDLGDRAVAKITVNETASICAFIGQTNNLTILGASGNLYTAQLTQDSKTQTFSCEMKTVSFLNEDEK